MNLLTTFFKDEVPAVGLSKFKEKELPKSDYRKAIELNLRKPAFEPNYSNNIFIL